MVVHDPVHSHIQSEVFIHGRIQQDERQGCFAEGVDSFQRRGIGQVQGDKAIHLLSLKERRGLLELAGDPAKRREDHRETPRFKLSNQMVEVVGETFPQIRQKFIIQFQVKGKKAHNRFGSFIHNATPL
jgi:hypothetical protein